MSELFAGTAKDAGTKPLQKKTTTVGAASAPQTAEPQDGKQVATKTLSPSQAEAARQRELQDKTTNAVLEHITGLQSEGKLMLPANYSPGNELKMAWLTLLEVEDRNGNKALDVCSRESIANTLLKMTIQGLSVAKKQAAFVVYGKKLELLIEYHGTIMLAKRYGKIQGAPMSNVIYDGDEFVYTIDPETGRKKIVKHNQSIANIQPDKIVGAYAVVTEEDGSKYVEIMSMQQIRQAWMQGATKGQSPAHKNFPDQMAIKTVIGRACKLYITTSDDGGIYGDEETTPAASLPTAKPQPAAREVIDTEYDEIPTAQLPPSEEKKEPEAKRPVEDHPMENAPRKPSF